MSYTEELGLDLSPETNSKIEVALKSLWNKAIDRAADVAERSFHEDEDGCEAMSPSTIASEIRKLKG